MPFYYHFSDPSSRECSEGVSPDKPIVSSKHIAMVPLGVASFASDAINIPGNASSAVSVIVNNEVTIVYSVFSHMYMYM